MENHEKMAERLNDLLQKNFDTEKQFRNAANDVENLKLKDFFMEKAQQRYDFGHQLKTEIRNFSEIPEEGSGFQADVQRTWMDLKAAVSGNKEESVLEEVVKGEEAAVKDYNKVLSESDFPPSTLNLLMRQRNAIRQSLDSIQTMERTFS